MIKVILYQSEGFEMSGHAGFAEHGKDIVCAAASVLATTCVNALETVANVVCSVEINEDQGYLKALLPPNLSTEQSHDASVILRSFRQGIFDLAEGNPKYITLKEMRLSK